MPGGGTDGGFERLGRALEVLVRRGPMEEQVFDQTTAAGHALPFDTQPFLHVGLSLMDATAPHGEIR